MVRCVESVLARIPAGSIEIIVVDNASTDGSKEELRSRFPGGEIRMIQNRTNRGFGTACNQGAATARADFLLFLNSDCEFVEDALTRPISILSERPEVGVLFCRLLNGDGSLQPSVNAGYPRVGGALLEAIGWSAFKHALFRTRRLKRILAAPVLVRHAAAGRVAWGGGNYMLMRKSVFSAVGGFDEAFFMYYEDADLCRRVNEKGCCWYDPGVSVVHHWARSVPTEGVSPLLENYRSRICYFRKHHPSSLRLVKWACGFELLTRLGLLWLLSRMGPFARWQRACGSYAAVWREFQAGFPSSGSARPTVGATDRT